MENFFNVIGVFLLNVVILGMVLLGIIAVLTIIVMVIDAFFGKAEPTTKTSSTSTTQNAGIVCDWDTADEAQRRFMQESIRSHEESVRMHDVAVREAWDAHTMACDQHQTAVEMHNDFSFGGCDPWF